VIGDDLASARRKCSFLAKEIVALRQSNAGPDTHDLIASHQSELDLLIARIAATREVEDGIAVVTD
jgi:hypothetical protein